MSLMLTYWEDPRIKRTEDDFNEILTIRLKTVKQIPELIASMPTNCTMISVEHSGNHRQKGKISNPTNPTRFKEYWRKGQPIPGIVVKCCPLCGKGY